MTFAARIPSGCLWCSQVGTVCGDPPVRLGSFLCLAHDALLGSHQDLVIAALEREPSVSVAALVAAAPAVVAPEPAAAVVPKVQPPLPSVLFDLAEAYRLRQKGWTYQRIADHMSVTINQVFARLKKYVPNSAAPATATAAEPEPEPEPVVPVPEKRRRAGPVKTIDRETVLRLLAQGLDALAVAERLGISRGSVYAIRDEGKDRGIAPAPALVPIPTEIRDPDGCSHLDESGKWCGRMIKASGLCAGHAYDRDPQALFRPRRRQVSFSRMREILATTNRAWGSARDFGAHYGENEIAISRALNEVETYRIAFDRIVGKLGWQRIDEVTYEQVAVESAKEAA